MHFVRGGGGDSPTNAPPLGAVHTSASAFSQLLLSPGVQLHSLEMRSFLGNLVGSVFSAISYIITLWRRELLAISASLCLICFILEVPRKISGLHVLKCEGGMSEWRIVSRHLISICINLMKANVREKERVSVCLFQLLMHSYLF